MPATVLRVLAALCLAAGEAAAQPPAPRSCDVVAQNLFVRDVMTDLYFWYQHVPRVDAAAFESPAHYLDAVRYRPLDASFSYIAPRASTEAFFSASQFIGFGISYAFAPGALHLTDVMVNSPAAEANLVRGDRIVEIGGRTVESLQNAGQLDTAFGPAEEGVSVDVVVVRGNERFRARMTKRIVTIPTVPLVRTYEAGGRRVGYVVFRNFVEPSFAALDEAFATLRAAPVTELVLDLRYNGGGLVGVAQHLASLIGGTRTEGAVFAEYFHNDRHPELNEAMRFEAKVNALQLERLVVITTRASASASELVVNALKPFMPVLVIGDRTYGKPVGQYALSFCDKTLAPVAFTLRNANGDGDYFEGIPATCTAADDLGRQLGDPLEDSLREALAVVVTGGCSARTAGTHIRQAAPAAAPPTWGWQSVLNAR
jgi:carboxyl-terminal processing protease